MQTSEHTFFAIGGLSGYAAVTLKNKHFETTSGDCGKKIHKGLDT